jgi:hypothetical protein
MMRWDEVWTKAQAWGCPCHPKKYPRSKSVKAWGCPEAPLLHRQISGHLSRHYIFISLYSMRFSWSVFFRFQFSFVLFAARNGWTPTYFFGEDVLCFSLPRTL